MGRNVKVPNYKVTKWKIGKNTCYCMYCSKLMKNSKIIQAHLSLVIFKKKLKSTNFAFLVFFVFFFFLTRMLKNRKKNEKEGSKKVCLCVVDCGGWSHSRDKNDKRKRKQHKKRLSVRQNLAFCEK